MKRIFTLIAIAASLAGGAALVATSSKPAHAQVLPICHDEMICTPIYGCRWVTFCK